MLKTIESIAREAGAYIMGHYGNLKNSQVSAKEGNHNLVTEIDKGCEKLIIAEIEKQYPDHSIFGEEHPEKKTTSDYQWIIDPIDGTNNFIHAVPYFCVSIGVAKKGVMEFGVIYVPYTNEMFTAEKGRGAFLNGKPIHVSAVDQFENSMLCTGFACVREDENHFNKQVFVDWVAKVDGLRRTGSAAMDLCYVAAGRFDGFWEFCLAPYDVAAGGIIVQEAGGIVSEVTGESNWVWGKSILAANPQMHPVLKQKLSGYLK